jgi:hypothetical protein
MLSNGARCYHHSEAELCTGPDCTREWSVVVREGEGNKKIGSQWRLVTSTQPDDVNCIYHTPISGQNVYLSKFSLTNDTSC